MRRAQLSSARCLTVAVVTCGQIRQKQRRRAQLAAATAPNKIAQEMQPLEEGLGHSTPHRFFCLFSYKHFWPGRRADTSAPVGENRPTYNSRASICPLHHDVLPLFKAELEPVRG